MLQKWDGELRYLPNFKFRRFGKKDFVRAQQKEQKTMTKMKKENKLTLEGKKCEEEKKPSTVLESAEMTEDFGEDVVPKENVIAEASSLQDDCKMIVE